MRCLPSIVSLLCLVCLMFSAIESGADQIESLIEQLGSEEKSVRPAQVALVEIGAPAIPALIEALKNGNRQVRARVAFVLSMMVGLPSISTMRFLKPLSSMVP